MKRAVVFICLIFVLCLSGGYAEGNSLKLIKAKGIVDIKEIGGRGLSVFSLWDRKQGAPVGPDGVFETTISDSDPQKLSVRDERGKTRALAIVLPEEAEGITFNALSTAEAILFQNPDLFRTSAEVKEYAGAMADKKSFQDLADFFKKNLPLMNLEELSENKECTALVEKCNTEIFKEDIQAIRRSLSEAKDKLQNAFQNK